jgi:hypothetical protein
MEALSSVKMTVVRLCWLLLWYAWLKAAIFCKRPRLLCQNIVICMTMPGVIHPTVQLFMAVHLINKYIQCSLSWWVHKYWVFWMVGFLCHLLIIYEWIISSSSAFQPAMPTQFCYLPYINTIYWKLHLSCLKIFSSNLQVSVCNVLCCTVGNFYHARDIFIIYCRGGGFLFVCLSEFLSGSLCI